MLKKNRAVGCSARNTSEDAELEVVEAGDVETEHGRHDGGHDRQDPEEPGEPVAAEQPLELAAEVPEDGDRDDGPDRWVSWRTAT